jgi:putative transposase
MRYDYGLRERVIRYVEKGGSKAEASRVYEVSRGTVYNWVNAGLERLKAYQKPGPKGRRSIDVQALGEAVAAHGDRMQKEHAREFGVSKSTIHRAMKELRITRKKNHGVHGKKR